LNALALTDALAVSQFRNEVDFLLMCQHINCVYCLGWGIRDDETRFLVLEFVQGGDLRHALKTHGDMFDSRTCLSVIRDVACGLDYLLKQFHRSHSDLKPDNILIDFEHSPPRGVCTDFGSLRVQAEPTLPWRRKTLYSRSNETKDIDQMLLGDFQSNGDVYDSLPYAPGSPLYMSPEIMHVRRFVIESVTPFSDAWALGVIMFELVHRTLPDLLALYHCDPGGPVSYRFRETHLLLDQGRTLWNAPDIQPAIDVSDAAGRELVRLSKACLQLDPERRPTFFAILQAYENILQSES
jgi:serine/threonine protein kinase